MIVRPMVTLQQESDDLLLTGSGKAIPFFRAVYVKWINLREQLYHRIYGSSCCVGGLAKSQSVPERIPAASKKKKIGQFSEYKKSQWSSSPEAMEKNVSICHSLDTNLSSATNTVTEGMKLQEENCNNSFVNQGVIAWNEMRRQWIGDKSKRSHRAPREPVISWSSTYEDLLATSQPFSQPIALSEMVDFLVDIWHEEGLYD
ncbi:hypothetical protein Cni_G19461 [Canna indica]|uniref:Gag1-like clamp domain-containing protein n=1 Tax=Canna indica TaxID=4628 RepID=A0AAQ3KN90_9LILI|nr:hypothetical protein Cni_G19461 [Canna indica]